MKVLGSIAILLMLAVMAVRADKRPRVTFFQRQTQYPSSPAPSPDKKPSGTDAGAGPYPPSNSGPYPPSGWKPAGPQLEYGAPDKNSSSANSSTDGASNSTESTATTTTSPTGSSPAKLASLAQPKSNIYYFVLGEGRLQPFVLRPVTAAFLQQSGSSQRIVFTKPLQLQIREVEPVQRPVYVYAGPLGRDF